MSPRNIRWCVEPGEIPEAPSPMRSFFKRMFCRHIFEKVSDHRYAITRHGRKIGDVSLLLLTCRHCGADRVIPHDQRMTS